MSMMDPNAAQSLARLQALWGNPLNVISEYRTPEYNAKVGGAKNSQHTKGRAYDVDVNGMSEQDRLKLINQARDAGFRGIGVYDNSLHFDTAGERMWGPDYTHKSVPDWARSNAQPLTGTAKAEAANMGLTGILDASGSGRPQQPAPQVTRGQPMQDGLLGQFGNQPDQKDLPFYQRDRFKDIAGGIATAANSLRHRPDPNLDARLAQAQQGRQQKQQTSKTVQWLQAQGRDDLAEAVLSGALDPRQAVGVLYQQPKDDRTSLIKNVEALMGMGLTQEQALAQVKSGSSIVNNVGGDAAPPSDVELRKKLNQKEGESWSTFLDVGAKSSGTMQDMQLLDEIITMAPQGPISGRLAEAFPGVSSAADAFNSVVKRVAPTLRAEGSGSTSDIEYNGMLKALPQLSSRPEANVAIAAMMKAKAQVNMDRAAVVRDYQNGTIDVASARGKLAEIDSKSIMTPELKAVLSGLGPKAESAAPDGAGAIPAGTVEGGYRFKGGDPSDELNWEKVQ